MTVPVVLDKPYVMTGRNQRIRVRLDSSYANITIEETVVAMSGRSILWKCYSPILGHRVETQGRSRELID
jgi:hypothetical protein